MEGFEALIAKYVQKGMQERNIEYAIDAVKYGTASDLIIANLTSRVREESKENAASLVHEIIKILEGPQKMKIERKSYYSSQQQKMYDDYIALSNEKLFDYVNHAAKYSDSVIEVIKDILVERHVLEIENPKIHEDAPKKLRHGCVTAWLVIMIAANAIFSIAYLAAGEKVLIIVPQELRPLVAFILIIAGILNIYFASLLLSWKKSGFTGLTVMSVIMFFVNLYMGLGFLTSITGLAGIFIFYIILQITKNGISAWEQLE